MRDQQKNRAQLIAELNQLREENAKLHRATRNFELLQKVVEQNETHLLLLQQSAHIGIWQWDSKENHITLTPLLCNILQIQSPVPVDDYLAHVHPADRETVQAWLEALFHPAELPPPVEYRWMLPDGMGVRWLQKYPFAEQISTPNIPSMRGILHDITAFKSTEITLKQTAEQFQSIFRQHPCSFILFEVQFNTQHQPCDYVIVDLNPACEALTGLNRETAIGHNILQLVPDLNPQLLVVARKTVLTKTAHHCEYYSELLDKYLWVQFFQPQPHLLCLMFVDLNLDFRQTPSEETEAYQRFFENSPFVMLIIDPENGNIIEANPAACTFYGYRSDVLICKRIQDINTLSEDQIALEMDQARQEKRDYFKFKHRIASGEVVEVEVYSRPIRLFGRTLLYSIIIPTRDEMP